MPGEKTKRKKDANAHCAQCGAAFYARRGGKYCTRKCNARARQHCICGRWHTDQAKCFKLGGITPGLVFGDWTVAGNPATTRQGPRVDVRCKCGRTSNLLAWTLTVGKSRSCRPCSDLLRRGRSGRKSRAKISAAGIDRRKGRKATWLLGGIPCTLDDLAVVSDTYPERVRQRLAASKLSPGSSVPLRLLRPGKHYRGRSK